MTNFEHYKEDIEKLPSLGLLAFCNGIKSCSLVSCNECKFSGKDCSQKAIKWLYSEYNEPPTLNVNEFNLCMLLGTGWIARDKDDTLCVYSREPYKKHNDSRWDCTTRYMCLDNLMFFNPKIKFDFITWDDKHPWKIEDLLKLEVKRYVIS